jgi:hypothetical protein
MPYDDDGQYSQHRDQINQCWAAVGTSTHAEQFQKLHVMAASMRGMSWHGIVWCRTSSKLAKLRRCQQALLPLCCFFHHPLLLPLQNVHLATDLVAS